MSVRNLDKIFKPRAIALIGATPKPHTVGAMLLKNLREAEFKGNLMLVNPRHTEIAGLQVYPDVASLPAVPDLAVIATPPAVVPRLIAERSASSAQRASRCSSRSWRPPSRTCFAWSGPTVWG